MNVDWKANIAVLTLLAGLAAFAYKDPQGHKKIVAPKLAKIVVWVWIGNLGAMAMGGYSITILTPFLDTNKQKLAEQAKSALNLIPLEIMLGVAVVFGFSVFLDVIARESMQLAEEKKKGEE